MTWKRTSYPHSFTTTYVSGDYKIVGKEEAYRSYRWFTVLYKGEFIDILSSLKLAKEVAADHAAGI